MHCIGPLPFRTPNGCANGDFNPVEDTGTGCTFVEYADEHLVAICHVYNREIFVRKAL